VRSAKAPEHLGSVLVCPSTLVTYQLAGSKLDLRRIGCSSPTGNPHSCEATAHHLATMRDSLDEVEPSKFVLPP